MPRPILIIVASKNNLRSRFAPLQAPFPLAAGRDRNLRSRFAPLQAPFPLAAGALAKLWCIKELRGSESRYSVLWARAL